MKLSELVNVTPSAISQYEKNHRSPSPDVVERLSKKLELPVRFFFLPKRDPRVSTVFYRSLSAATKTARRRAENRFRWLQDIVEFLSDFVDFPSVNLPDLDLPADPLLLSHDDIESVAEAARRYWNLREGPIANVVAFLEHQGVVVARDALGAATLESMSEFAPSGQPFVMIGTDKGTFVRWRFDAAHELGHLLLHRQIDRARLRRTADFKRLENQAHRFASAFLLPLDAFGEEISAVSLDAFAAMKTRWNTSIAMMIRRARDANFISEVTERRLWINYSRRGWRGNEPFDEAPPEIPTLLRQALDGLESRSNSGIHDLIAVLGLSSGDVESLVGVRGELPRWPGEGQASGEVIELMPRTRRRES